MLWFRYRWILTFSHGLCVKIIRGGEAVKWLSENIDDRLSSFEESLSIPQGVQITNMLLKLIDILDDLVFSASALLYREEKDLIKFSKRVEKAAERLVFRLRREKGKYGKDARELQKMMKDLKKKKQRLPRRLKRKVEHEKEAVEEDEARKKVVVSLLHDVTNFIEEMDGKLHGMHLEAKTQRRGTLNAYRIKENVIIRSNFRIGELTGRKGIEADKLINRIRKKLNHFRRIVGRSRNLSGEQVIELLKWCRLEYKDLYNVFLFVVQLSERVKSRLHRFGQIISNKENLSMNFKLQGLSWEYNLVRERLKKLRKDIQTQQRRLDNQFKKGGFTPHAQIKKEIRQALK